MRIGVAQVVVVAGVALAGCGRIGFDLIGTGLSDDGGPGDGDGDSDGGEVDAGRVSPACADDATLVACYELDDNLDDESGNGNHLTGQNIAFVADVDGPGGAGRALQLDQTSMVTGPGSTPSLDVSAAVTVEAWIRPTSSQTRWFVDHDNQWGMELCSDGAVFCVLVVDEGAGGAVFSAGGGDVAVAEWSHLACRYDGDTLAVYHDGIEIDRNTAPAGPIDTASDGGFTVGQDAPTGKPFLGAIDRVRVWSAARTDEQIRCSAQRDC